MASQSTSRDQFLKAVHDDWQLQQALENQEIAQAALKVARAAGFALSVSDLVRTTPMTPATTVQPSMDDELESIDFDGDGAPDAVLKDGRWMMLDSLE